MGAHPHLARSLLPTRGRERGEEGEGLAYTGWGRSQDGAGLSVEVFYGTTDGGVLSVVGFFSTTDRGVPSVEVLYGTTDRVPPSCRGVLQVDRMEVVCPVDLYQSLQRGLALSCEGVGWLVGGSGSILSTRFAARRTEGVHPVEVFYGSTGWRGCFLSRGFTACGMELVLLS